MRMGESMDGEVIDGFVGRWLVGCVWCGWDHLMDGFGIRYGKRLPLFEQEIQHQRPSCRWGWTIVDVGMLFFREL